MIDRAKYYTPDMEIYFKEKSVGNSFIAYPRDGIKDVAEWVFDHGYTHLIRFSHRETRWARISRTRAWVAVDEDEMGPVEEKWEIKVRSAFTV